MPNRRSLLGRFGEWWACLFLLTRGYRIVARNLQTPHAEVDIVARRCRVLVLCEVKTRRGSEEVVVRQAQRTRLLRAALWVQPRFAPRGYAIRLDLVIVRLPRRGWWRPTIEIYRAAFSESDPR